MIKKLIITMLFVLIFPSMASAFSVISMDDPEGVVTGPFYHAENDEIRIEYASGVVTKTIHSFYHDANFESAGTSKTNTAPSGSSYLGSGFTCVGWYEFQAFNFSGQQVAHIKIQVEEGDLQSPRCNSDSNPGDVAEGCEGCAIFECPGWGDFMGKLDDIKAAIPPVPNWPVVADVFRDSIAPQIKQDMAELIGTAPEPVMPTLPNAPNLPPEPIMLEDVRSNIELPVGKETPELGDSSFNENDIKNSAPVIEEREDPTGGFKIDNPVDTLPSQDEFTKNVPKEGVAPLPGNPKDPDNIAPTPGDTKDKAPIPGDTGDPAPMPGNTNNTAPIPGNTNNTAPIPNEGGKAPIPGDDDQFLAPIP